MTFFLKNISNNLPPTVASFRLTSEQRMACRGRDEMEGSWCRSEVCIPSASQQLRYRRRVARGILLVGRFPSLKTENHENIFHIILDTPPSPHLGWELKPDLYAKRTEPRRRYWPRRRASELVWRESRSCRWWGQYRWRKLKKPENKYF